MVMFKHIILIPYIRKNELDGNDEDTLIEQVKHLFNSRPHAISVEYDLKLLKNSGKNSQLYLKTNSLYVLRIAGLREYK